MEPATATRPDSCFLSYSRADADFALRFAKDLCTLGVTMWVDRLDIRPSENWDRAIERAIRGCRTVVAILSPRAVASENVADEISLAIDTGKPIIPIIIEPCKLPLRLARKHLIDASGGYDEALEQCFAEIQSGGDRPNRHAATPEFARGVNDPEAVTAAKRELAAILGPIAGILVERAAARAASVEGLYRLLALHIPNDADRQSFISGSGHSPLDGDAKPGADGQPIKPSELEPIARALANYLGPIALVVTRKESQAAGSVKELLGRLAARLKCERDKAEFLAQVESR